MLITGRKQQENQSNVAYPVNNKTIFHTVQYSKYSNTKQISNLFVFISKLHFKYQNILQDKEIQKLLQNKKKGVRKKFSEGFATHQNRLNF